MAKSVLVVDDEQEVREVVGVILHSLGGYQVRFAEDGLVALKKLEAFTPDLIILDMMMLNMDGLSFMLKMDEQENTIPILVLTAHEAAYKTAAKRLGEERCIMKPFEVDDLLARVRAILDTE